MLQQIIDAIVDGITYALRWTVARILEALSGVINSIPAPEWLHAPAWGEIAATVGFILGPMQLGYGLTVVGGAYGVRFMLRALPGVF